MNSDLTIESVELDLPFASSENIKIAKRIFDTNDVKKRGKYSADPKTFISIVSSITSEDIVKELLVAIILGGLTAGYKKICNFLIEISAQKPEMKVLATYTIKSAGLIWEFRFDPKVELSQYVRALIINCVDISDIHPDAYRISINLVDGYVKAFDEQNQFVSELPFDNPII